MTTTLVTDDFEPGPTAHKYGDPLVHNIVYGALGWVDHLDTATIRALVEAGAIVLDRTERGPGWVSNLYTSAKGAIPDAT